MMKTGKTIPRILAFALCGFLLLPAPAQALLCEEASMAEEAIDDMNQKIVDDFNDLLEQEQWFIDHKLMETAKHEMTARINEFADNLTEGFGEWWRDNNEGDDPEPKGLFEHLKPIAKQLHFTRTQQTQHLGALVDAEMTNETVLRLQQQHVKATQKYAVNENSCQLDTVGTVQSAAAVKSRAIAQGFTADNQPRILNSKPAGAAPATPGLYRDQYDIAKAASKGGVTEQAAQFKEYQQYFCNPAAGDQGCTAPGLLAGKNTDLPGLLWGNRQSSELGATPAGENNRRVHNAVLRTMISPRTAPPIPKDAVDTVKGEEQILRRRAHAGRTNAVYNVVSAMLAERVGTAGVDTADIRVASGLDMSDASVTASYREIQEAMSRDRFINPEYTARLIGSPTEVAREEVGVNAMRMQQMSDMYKRMEEMLVMEAAVYAGELDKKMPGDGIELNKIRE